MLARWVRIAQHTIQRSYSVEVASVERSRSGGRDTLGRRLLSLIFPKRSAVVTLRKWAEEGKPLRKYELNRVVRELRNFKRYKHALEICEWMRTQQDIKLLPGDYAVHLDLIAKVRGLPSAEKFFEDLPEKMRGQTTCTALLHNYVRNKLSAKAEALIDKMSECGFLKSPLPYNHMVTLYIVTGQFEKIHTMIEEIKKKTSPDVFTYNLWLNACAIGNDVEGAEKVFLELKKDKIPADWVTYSTLAGIYISTNLPEKARDALQEIEKRVSRKERVAYCSLITLYANLWSKDDVYRIWKKMKAFFLKMNDAEYTSMISSLVKLGDIKEAEGLYDEWCSISGTRDSRVPNILLAAYVKESTMDKAKKFHELTVERGIVPCYSTWEILARGYISAGEMDKVLDCLKKAFSSVRKWEPNDEIVQTVFSNLEMQGDIKGAEQFLAMLRDVGHMTTGIYNSLLRTYARAGKMPLIVVERMKKDNVELDEETDRLIKATSKLCVSEVSSILY
ncbi:pentatricopeptide repeat-containing protein At4g02820, mitochondrial [Magnolia sinica]|uniref:pentatricopeptide repeat-containing protein At4g02820, mitochondrial n=1 Tax=Magnolia sinica TaxID=86752 RepID=UPI002658787D|nr:pentatricopeptide repeat-containing protein At4g02820, mitochondrial [Magnolia sinica]